MTTEVASKESCRSKTQELRELLYREIQRLERDENLLEESLVHLENAVGQGPHLGRYWGLTSNERAEKVFKDREELQRIKDKLRFLRPARELNIDVDLMERAIPGLLIEVRDYSPYGFPMIIGEMQTPLPHFTRFVMAFEPMELHIFTTAKYMSPDFRFLSLHRIEAREASYGHPYGYIRWYFPNQIVILGSPRYNLKEGSKVTLSIVPF